MTTTYSYTTTENAEYGLTVHEWQDRDGAGIQIAEVDPGSWYVYSVTIPVDGQIIEVTSFGAPTLEQAKGQAEFEYEEAKARQ